MQQSVTTSIRLSPELRAQLEQKAAELDRGKNWIITQALIEFLAKATNEALQKEARRQSLLASKMDQEDADIWHDNQDDTGWH